MLRGSDIVSDLVVLTLGCGQKWQPVTPTPTCAPSEWTSLSPCQLSVSVNLSLPVCLFMLYACHLSISVFITLSVCLFISLSPHHLLSLSLSLTVCFWSPLYLCPTFCQSQGFSLSLSFRPHQLSFIDVFLDALCFPPRSFFLHLSLSLSLSLHTRSTKHSVFTVSLNLHRNQEQFVNKRLYCKHKNH